MGGARLVYPTLTTPVTCSCAGRMGRSAAAGCGVGVSMKERAMWFSLQSTGGSVAGNGEAGVRTVRDGLGWMSGVGVWVRGLPVSFLGGW